MLQTSIPDSGVLNPPSEAIVSCRSPGLGIMAETEALICAVLGVCADGKDGGCWLDGKEMGERAGRVEALVAWY